MSLWSEAGQQPQEVVVGTTVAALILAVLVFQLRKSSHKNIPADTVVPPHVKAWIPYLGSAIEMGTGIAAFIRSRAKQFNSPVFTATIMGDKCIFFNDPELLNVVYKPKYKKYLDPLSLQKLFMQQVVGMTDEEIQETFTTEIFSLGMKQYHHYLFKGQELERSIGCVQEYFNQNVPSLSNSNNNEWTSHKMFHMVTTAVFNASVGPIMSDYVMTDEASVEMFRAFDKGIIPLFNKAPSFLTQNARQARSYLLELVGSDKFWNQASPLMKERQKTMPLLSTTLNRGNVGLLFAVVANSAPAIYWALLRLMQDPPAWEACLAQVEAIVEKKKNKGKTGGGTGGTGGSNNITFTLDDLDEMTLLESVLWETLRLYQGNFTARIVTEDFVLETKTQKYLMEKGSKMMPFWAILHSDPDIFPNPDQFQYDRFVGKPEFYFKDGTKINFFPVVAFGGGEHLCPGRKFISYESRLYLALLMLNFDMRLAEGDSIPGIDLTMQGLGVSHPDKEITVEIRTRQSN